MAKHNITCLDKYWFTKEAFRQYLLTLLTAQKTKLVSFITAKQKSNQTCDARDKYFAAMLEDNQGQLVWSAVMLQHSRNMNQYIYVKF